MDKVCTLYDALAGLLVYPDAGYHRRVTACRQTLADRHPEATQLMDRFAERVAPLSAEELEELYTQTFDLNPVCSLEVGWHLFGENYSRGEFLVTMRQELRRSALPESTELPDHLTHVVAAVARMEPRQADRFTITYLLPALEKMLKGLAGKDSPYEHVLEAIRCVLLSPYGAVLQG
jgi:nitrate reductase delta subunit